MIKSLALCAAFLAHDALAADPFDGGAVAGAPLGRNVAVASGTPVAVEPGNVILLMFDGVRWQEFLHNKPDGILSKDAAATFPTFWSALAKQGVVYDDMTISNRAELSMPAYHSIFAGSTQPCKDNDCGRVTVETFPERLVRELKLAPEQVATFSSWTGIALAVEHVKGATFVDAGDGGKTRLDVDTFPKAMAHLKANKPRFLYISLNDADEQGHAGNYPEYLAALRRYDAWMAELIAALDGMGAYGKATTLIVTTDHGRGLLWDWRSHGSRPWARRVWAYARNPRSSKKGLTIGGRTHVDVRPTIETLLGLNPCAGCAAGFGEVLAP